MSGHALIPYVTGGVADLDDLDRFALEQTATAWVAPETRAQQHPERWTLLLGGLPFLMLFFGLILIGIADARDGDLALGIPGVLLSIGLFPVFFGVLALGDRTLGPGHTAYTPPQCDLLYKGNTLQITCGGEVLQETVLDVEEAVAIGQAAEWALRVEELNMRLRESSARQEELILERRLREQDEQRLRISQDTRARQEERERQELIQHTIQQARLHA